MQATAAETKASARMLPFGQKLDAPAAPVHLIESQDLIRREGLEPDTRISGARAVLNFALESVFQGCFIGCPYDFSVCNSGVGRQEEIQLYKPFCASRLGFWHHVCPFEVNRSAHP